MSRDDRAFALGLIDGSAYPGAVAELAERIGRAIGEARDEGRREVLDRLGPIVADAEVARDELARELYP